MFRLLLRIGLIGLACAALLLGTLVVIAHVYEEEVKAKLVEELNAHLKAPLHQNGIELTLIKRFPQASLRIRDVLMYEVRTDDQVADTLVHAEDLYLEFGLLSLLTGNYTISEVHGKNVRLNAGFDTNGAENWLVWKTDSTSTGGADLDLKQVTFDGLRPSYHDDRSGTWIHGRSASMKLQARFRDGGSTLKTNGDLNLLTWSDAKGNILTDRTAELRLTLEFGGADGAFRITKGEVLTGNTPINVTLAVENGAKGRTLDLHANGFGLGLADIVALLPEGINRPLRHYGLKGKADLALRYSGPLDALVLTAGMGLKEGELRETATGTTFRDVRGEFALELDPSGSPRKITVKDLHARSSSGNLSGNLQLNGLTKAKVKADIKGDLALADLLRFARVDTLEQVEGRLHADVHVNGTVRDAGNIRAADLRALAITGTAQLRDASLKLKGVRHRITGLNAELALAGNDAHVHGLRCNLQGNSIELTGTLRNLMPYAFFPGESLAIEAKGRSPRLDLATLLVEEGTSTPRKGDYTFRLPALIALDLKADIGTLVMEHFTAERIQGTVRLQDRVLSVSPLSFSTAQGSVRGSLRLDGRGEGAYPLTVEADLKGIDVPALFAEFQDFGQTFLTHKHLNGTGDAKLTLSATLRSDFTLDQDRLHCIADVTVTNGQLKEHASLLAVADHLRQNKLVSPFVDTEQLRSKLRNVTFAKLENRIEIKDRQVHLPLMTVSSSVMDLEVSGAHGFDGQVDDHLNFRLGDLFRTADSGHDEFGPIIDDGTGLRIFLHMYGTTSDLKFGNDGAMAAAKRKEKMKQETAELKGILKGILTGEKAAVPPPQQGRITVDWNGPGGEQQTTSAVPAPAPKARKGLGRLLDPKDDEEEKVIIDLE
ncbi:MAG TPA: AsmA-like C-terminal region-containing protein [Flavobacteriales bacterium]